MTNTSRAEERLRADDCFQGDNKIPWYYCIISPYCFSSRVIDLLNPHEPLSQNLGWRWVNTSPPPLYFIRGAWGSRRRERRAQQQPVCILSPFLRFIGIFCYDHRSVYGTRAISFWRSSLENSSIFTENAWVMDRIDPSMIMKQKNKSFLHYSYLGKKEALLTRYSSYFRCFCSDQHSLS